MYLIGKTGLERPAVVYNNLDILSKELVKVVNGGEVKDRLEQIFKHQFIPGVTYKDKIATKASYTDTGFFIDVPGRAL